MRYFNEDYHNRFFYSVGASNRAMAFMARLIFFRDSCSHWIADLFGGNAVAVQKKKVSPSLARRHLLRCAAGFLFCHSFVLLRTGSERSEGSASFEFSGRCFLYQHDGDQRRWYQKKISRRFALSKWRLPLYLLSAITYLLRIPFHPPYIATSASTQRKIEIPAYEPVWRIFSEANIMIAPTSERVNP